MTKIESANGRQPCVLLVEDDATISDLLAYNLRRAGLEVLQEYEGRSGIRAALGRSVDLVLMDVMLPGIDGMTASREIAKTKPEVPIIIVSALSDRDALVRGFELGADDYVTKPFDMEVLLARISASLRRASTREQPSALPTPGGAVSVGALTIDPDTRALRTPAGEVPLTPTEHDLLQLLLTQPGHLFSREEITESVWHHHYIASSRTLDVHMRRLRDKLRAVEAGLTVQAMRGIGYRLAPPGRTRPDF
jgi:two-component system, OmpR family, alkaline phosphatase synthesis response regulator PhoP